MCVNVQEGGGGRSGWVWRIDRTKLEEKVHNLKEKDTKIRNETLFRSFAKQLETLCFVFSYFFQFRETIEIRRNSDLFRTIKYFAKLKKIRNCQP